MMARERRAPQLVWGLVLLCAIVSPWGAEAGSQPFYISVATRALAYGVAASGLNLMLGYGGMVSLGQAAFFGLGAYASAIMTTEAASAGAPG
jgi:branched-chain amino acid transport system permease protein